MRNILRTLLCLCITAGTPGISGHAVFAQTLAAPRARVRAPVAIASPAFSVGAPSRAPGAGAYVLSPLGPMASVLKPALGVGPAAALTPTGVVPAAASAGSPAAAAAAALPTIRPAGEAPGASWRERMASLGEGFRQISASRHAEQRLSGLNRFFDAARQQAYVFAAPAAAAFGQEQDRDCLLRSGSESPDRAGPHPVPTPPQKPQPDPKKDQAMNKRLFKVQRAAASLAIPTSISAAILYGNVDILKAIPSGLLGLGAILGLSLGASMAIAAWRRWRYGPSSLTQYMDFAHGVKITSPEEAARARKLAVKNAISRSSGNILSIAAPRDFSRLSLSQAQAAVQSRIEAEQARLAGLVRGSSLEEQQTIKEALSFLPELSYMSEKSARESLDTEKYRVGLIEAANSIKYWVNAQAWDHPRPTWRPAEPKP